MLKELTNNQVDPMAKRLIAIGDIHGCSTALRQLINTVQPESTDTIITLGDYINRGPDARGVIDQLIALRDVCTLIPLLGNHDQLLLQNRSTRSEIPGYSVTDPDNGLERFGDEHFSFLETCQMFFENDTHLFVHANYNAKKQLADQDPYTLLWLSLDAQMPRRHFTRKTAIVGHTSQKGGEILDCGYLKCIDTYCYGGGWLTAMEVRSGQLWQVNQHGIERQIVG
jgi:serine/threonine protein phosphatase 1